VFKRNLDDRPEATMRHLRELLAKRLGLPVEPERSIWTRVWEWLRGSR
jgi:hypothetical protein